MPAILVMVLELLFSSLFLLPSSCHCLHSREILVNLCCINQTVCIDVHEKKTMCEGKPTLKGAIRRRLPKGNQKYKTRILPEHSITSFLCKRLWCSTLMMGGGFSCFSSLQLLAQVVLHGSSFTSGLRWSTLLTLGQITQNNIIFPLVADKTSVAYCFLSYPLVFSLYTSASSSPVVYFNVVWMEQLVVTWG